CVVHKPRSADSQCGIDVQHPFFVRTQDVVIIRGECVIRIELVGKAERHLLGPGIGNLRVYDAADSTISDVIQPRWHSGQRVNPETEVADVKWRSRSRTTKARWCISGYVEQCLVNRGLGLLNGEQRDVLEDLVTSNAVTTPNYALSGAGDVPSEAKAGLEFFPVRS